MVAHALFPALLLTLACHTDATDSPADETPEAKDTPIAPMDDLRLLSRMSLDLRGVRPSPEEIARVEADPAALDEILEEMLRDDRFGDQIRSMYGEVYLTEADYFDVNAAQFGIDDNASFLEAIGQEPLRILDEVAQTDRPWTDIVTADWTVANETLAFMFPIDHEGEGWQVARYTDSRPAAGVLSTTGMWLRYTSTASNANRSRANTVSRIMLCNDYLTRPIEFDREVDLLDQGAVDDALNNNAACVNCHVSLDPMAAYFFGFWTFQQQSWVEVSTYHPERERLYNDYLGMSPAYYGQPGSSLADLGRQIASDPRFAECAVEQMYGMLLRRDVTLADMDPLTAHREAFLEGGLTMRALVRSIVQDPRYRADTKADAPTAQSTKMLSADQLASSIEGITGFRWEYLGYDMLRNDLVGVRTLAGGADGNTVTRNTTAPNTTIMLVHERLSEAAAAFAVARDMEAAGAGEPAELFTQIDFTETPASDEAAMVAQLQDLHLRIFGQPVDAGGEEIAANLALWQTLYDIDQNIPAAWAGVTVALLRDPDFLLY
ncbi:MAG: DUF1585 domain-containing protein [Myxococcota bacterium]